MLPLPSLNWTEPATPGGLIVAVNVSTVFAADGESGDTSNAVVVTVGVVAPPVPVAHGIGAAVKSHGGGCGTVSMSRSVPSADNVGLWQFRKSSPLIFWVA